MPTTYLKTFNAMLFGIGVLVLIGGYNLYADGSKYHTGFYLLFLLGGLVHLSWNTGTAWPIVRHPLYLALLLFLLTIALAQAYPDTLTTPARQLQKALMLGLSVLLLAQFVSQYEKAFWKLMGLAAVAVSISALWQLYRYYGLDAHLPSDRFNGYYIPENPLYMAQSLGFFFLLSVHLALRFRRQLPWLLVMSATAIICLAAALATQSRAFVLAAILSLLFSFGLRHDLRHFFKLLLALLAAVGGLLWLYPELINRTESIRLQVWPEAWSLIQQKLLFGWGGEYDPALQAGRELGLELTDPHNLLLTIWMKYGLAAVATLILLLSSALLAAWKIPNNALIRLGGGTLLFGIIMLSFEGHNIVSRPTVTWHMIWIPLGFILGGLIVEGRKPATDHQSASSSPPSGQGTHKLAGK